MVKIPDMDVKDSGSLCRECARFDLEPLITAQRNDSPQEIYYWDLTRVYHQQHCPLCRLIVKCLLEDDQITVADLEKQGVISGSYARYELLLKIRLRDHALLSSNSIQLCPAEQWTSLDQLQGVRTVKCDPGEISLWLAECDEHHPTCHSNTGSAHGLPTGFRLIDIERGCIVTAGSDPSYCALSYVWGKATQLILTTQNLETLEKDMGFFNNEIALPKTISDAMELCQQIGYRYFWVDCLCIISDDNEQYIQINAMDAIYNRADLTIIAASGNDANAGLIPFKNFRQLAIHSEWIRELRAFSAPSPRVWAQAITTSKWASRGWTLQECCLARRVVIFTETYVFYRCGKALRGENFGLPLFDLRSNTWDWDLPVPRIIFDLPRDLLYPKSFEHLLGQYIHRHLTKEEDFLDAFRGILCIFSHTVGPHRWGLPALDFGVALLWAIDRAHATGRRKGFPSWSWTGWLYDHSNDFDLNIFHTEKNTRAWSGCKKISVLSSFYVGQEGQVQCFDGSSFDKSGPGPKSELFRKVPSPPEAKALEAFEGHFTVPLHKETIVEQHADRIRKDVPEHISQCVFFWTSYAQIPFTRKPGQRQSIGSRFFYFEVAMPECKLSVPLLPEWREMQPDSLHCIVTAIYSERNGGSWTRPTSFFWVLFIERDTSTEMDVFSRVLAPAFPIKITDWRKVSPEMRLITLI